MIQGYRACLSVVWKWSHPWVSVRVRGQGAKPCAVKACYKDTRWPAFERDVGVALSTLIWKMGVIGPPSMMACYGDC